MSVSVRDVVSYGEVHLVLATHPLLLELTVIYSAGGCAADPGQVPGEVGRAQGALREGTTGTTGPEKTCVFLASYKKRLVQCTLQYKRTLDKLQGTRKTRACLNGHPAHQRQSVSCTRIILDPDSKSKIDRNHSKFKFFSFVI